MQCIANKILSVTKTTPNLVYKVPIFSYNICISSDLTTIRQFYPSYYSFTLLGSSYSIFLFTYSHRFIIIPFLLLLLSAFSKNLNSFLHYTGKYIKNYNTTSIVKKYSLPIPN